MLIEQLASSIQHLARSRISTTCQRTSLALHTIVFYASRAIRPSNCFPIGDKKAESRILFLKSASQTCVDLRGIKLPEPRELVNWNSFQLVSASKERAQNTAREIRRKNFLQKK